jgi:16S rRNA processing protein RimM
VDDLVQVAKILRSHGIKGELKIKPVNAHLGKLKGPWYIADRFGSVKEVHVEDLRWANDEGIIKLKEIGDRSEADGYARGSLLVERSHLAKLPSGEFYVYDIIGLDVQDEEKRKIGTVRDVYSQAPNDLYEIDTGEKICLIPAVAAIVKKIDLKKKILTIHVIDGLLD